MRLRAAQTHQEDKDFEIVQENYPYRYTERRKKKTEKKIDQPQYLVGWCQRVNI